jgi:serine/threonine-protein kinase HipA
VTGGKERLAVLHGSDPVGFLNKENDGRLVFEYSNSWLDSPDAFAVSLSLPLRREPFKDERPGRFFANLLPEGRLRSLVARRLGLSEENDYALLEAVGGECAGALSVLPENQSESLQATAEYTPLSTKELAEIAAAGEVLPFVTGERRTRLSLAGAQDKLPVLVEDGKYYLPVGNSPSSHILKFPNRDFSHLPANEVLITRLAEASGLRVVEVEWKVLGAGSACLVTRYDRRRNKSGSLVRIHQEDFCQAMGLSHTTKYEGEGGPLFSACFALVSKACTDPLPDTEQMLRWQAFNATVGNADGHAKNLSLLLETSHSIRLASFYDLVCTRAYRNLDRNLAMRVGGVADPGQIRGKDWIRLAGEIGVGGRFLLGLVREVAESVRSKLDTMAQEFRSRYGDSPAVQMVVQNAGKQARRIIRQLKT